MKKPEIVSGWYYQENGKTKLSNAKAIPMPATREEVMEEFASQGHQAWEIVKKYKKGKDGRFICNT